LPIQNPLKIGGVLENQERILFLKSSKYLIDIKMAATRKRRACPRGDNLF